MTSPNSVLFPRVPSPSLSPPLFLYFPHSPTNPPSSSDIIEGIWCKIRIPAKPVLDYLVMPPPHSGFKLNFSNSKMNPGQILINRKICDWYPTAIISLTWLTGYNVCQLNQCSARLNSEAFYWGKDSGRLCWPDMVKTESIFISTYQQYILSYVMILYPVGFKE